VGLDYLVSVFGTIVVVDVESRVLMGEIVVVDLSVSVVVSIERSSV